MQKRTAQVLYAKMHINYIVCNVDLFEAELGKK
jgi:hypothetical protein